MRLSALFGCMAVVSGLPHHRHRRALTWADEPIKRDETTAETTTSQSSTTTSKTTSTSAASKSTSSTSTTTSSTSSTSSTTSKSTSSSSSSSSTSTSSTSSTSTSSTSSTSTSSTSSTSTSSTSSKSTSSTSSKSTSTSTSSTSSSPSSSSSSSSSSITSMSSSSTLAMPSLTDALLLTSVSIYIPAGATYDSSNPTGYPSNPYISESNLPDGLLFIVVGAIVGTVLAALLAYRFVLWHYARKLAKIGKENEYNNFDFRGFSDIGSNLSFFDVASSSMMGKTMSRRSSMLMLHPPQLSSVSLPDILTSSGGSDNSFSGNEKTSEMAEMTTSQGRSYRDTVVGTSTKRGSMFISPVMAMMHKNGSSLALGGEMSSYYDYANNSSIALGSEPQSPMLTFDGSSQSSTAYLLKDHGNSEKTETEGSSSKKVDNRPPSQYLEDLLENF